MLLRRLGLRRAVTSVLALACVGGLLGASYDLASARVDPPAASYARGTLTPSTEVWQQAERAYDENRSNPLADRVWGVYQGPQDQTSGPFLAARGKRHE